MRISHLAAAAFALAALAFAQDAAVPPGSTRWIRFGGQLRGRMEAPAGADFVADPWSPYLLTRARLNVTVTPFKGLTLYAETQDTHALGYNGTPTPQMQDPLDLRAAYAEFSRGKDRGFMLRVGRQEMALGNSRLISIGPWSNTSKSLDAARAAFFRPGFRFELIAGSIVQVDGTRFDRHRPGEHFFASYNTIKNLAPRSVFEPYLIVKRVVGVVGELGPRGDAVVYTGGGRWSGTLPHRIDYSAEMLRQWGSWASDTVSAWGGTYTLGWTLSNSARKPRASADFSIGSGDRSPADGKRGGLDTLYGSNQPFFSYTGMINWRNMRTLRAGTDFALRKNVKVFLDFRDFYLATVADGLLNTNGVRIVLNRKATSTHVGEGPDVQLAWSPEPYGQVTAGFAAIFAGSYLRQSGFGSGYLHPYLMWQKRF
jgi:hypothetical protein